MAIDKISKKIKNDNRGMSLIEILVTIAMILILAGPLINSLLNSRIVNSNARLTQNGTTVAQDMAEKFKTIPIEELCETYNDKYTVDEATGIYSFSNIEVNGPNGEDFKVNVTLDPTAYVSGNEDEKNPVNNEKLPGMSSIYGSNCIKLYKYYTAADEKLGEMFKSKVNNTSITNNIYNDTYRKGLSKETQIIINCEYSSITERYEYDVDINLKYTFSYKTGSWWNQRYYTKDVSHQEKIENVSFSVNEVPMIYLICPIFDICTNQYGYCSDEINIKYEFHDTNGGTKPDLYFYLAEQETYKKGSTSIKQKINPANVLVDGSDLLVYNATSSKLKLCTNITATGNTNLLDLTYKLKDSGISLYEMTVEVSEKDKVVAEFISTK